MQELTHEDWLKACEEFRKEIKAEENKVVIYPQSISFFILSPKH
jgi:hypothetical protein